jgi:hypothetical protein
MMIAKVKKMKQLVSSLKRSFPLLIAMGMMVSCLNDQEMPIEITPIAYVSFYHGSTQSDELQIRVDNNSYPRHYTPFKFGTYIDYGNFYTGNRNFSFGNLGTVNSLLDTAITLKASQAYSVFLADEADLFLPIVVEDKLTNPGAGKALIRLAHLSPDTEEVDLFIGNGNTPVFEGSSFHNITDFKVVNSGAAVLKLNSGQSGETLVTTAETTIREGRIYTLVIRGRQDNSSGSANNLGIQVIRNYPNY